MSFIFDEAFDRYTEGDLNNGAGTVITLTSAATDNRLYMSLVQSTPNATSTAMDNINEITGGPTQVLSNAQIVDSGVDRILDADDPVFSSLTTPTAESVTGVVVGVRLGATINKVADLPLVYITMNPTYTTQTSGSPTLNVTIPADGLMKIRK